MVFSGIRFRLEMFDPCLALAISCEYMPRERGHAANGDFGAFNAATKVPSNWAEGDVGLLSLSELESSIPVCDSLKSPRQPVWVLHGGDHYTVLFAAADGLPAATAATAAADAAAAEDAGDAAAAEPMMLMHYNGLPPAGPRMASEFSHGPRLQPWSTPPAMVHASSHGPRMASEFSRHRHRRRSCLAWGGGVSYA
jgi:hypothetical protein